MTVLISGTLGSDLVEMPFVTMRSQGDKQHSWDVMNNDLRAV